MMNDLRTIGVVLASWYRFYATYIPLLVKEACVFYYRLATNKIGLPTWLWLLVMAGMVVACVAYLLNG